jgi:hypothetical protein
MKKKEFSEELQKAIESKKIIIDEIRKLAVINNPILWTNENWQQDVWKLRWNFGMQAELQTYDYYVMFE